MDLGLPRGEQHQFAYVDVGSGNLHTLPFVRIVLQPSLNIDPIALFHVFLCELGQAGPKREPMPIGPLLAVVSERRTVGCQAQVHDLGSALGLESIGIASDVSYQNDLVDGAAHLILPRKFAAGP